jgi:hypothetical protein
MTKRLEQHGGGVSGYCSAPRQPKKLRDAYAQQRKSALDCLSAASFQGARSKH